MYIYICMYIYMCIYIYICIFFVLYPAVSSYSTVSWYLIASYLMAGDVVCQRSQQSLQLQFCERRALQGFALWLEGGRLRAVTMSLRWRSFYYLRVRIPGEGPANFASFVWEPDVLECNFPLFSHGSGRTHARAPCSLRVSLSRWQEPLYRSHKYN